MPAPDTRLLPGDLLPAATRRLIRTADSLAEADYAAASPLPGWTRGHVLAHLALNAEGLAAALTGIVEDRKVPMYASQEARNGDIEELAGAGPSETRRRLLASATDLADALAGVPDDRLDVLIERVPGGRTFAAGDVASMRLREVEIHHVDLAAGYDRSHWEPAFATHLLDVMTARDVASAPYSAYAVDLDRTWTCGGGGPTVTGAAVDLAWWLTGRGDGEGLSSDDGDLPRIGAL
jgi:maleylpyruvate isomerase